MGKRSLNRTQNLKPLSTNSTLNNSQSVFQGFRYRFLSPELH